MYGTTYYGGTSANCENGCGVLYKIKPDGTGYSILLDFNYVQNGGRPSRSLISDGTFLYGMTADGGNCGIYYEGCGTIFKIKPDGSSYTKLQDFNGTNGLNPYSALIFDGTFLYGITGAGGTSSDCPDGCGVLFKIKPDGSGYVKLHDFDNTDGSYPSGPLLLNNGCLYGTSGSGGTGNCSAGCGVIFSYCLSNAISDYNTENEFTIFPNPFSISTTLSIRSSVNNFNNLIFELYNCVGQTVKQVENIDGHTIILQRGNLASGLYFIRLLSENKTIAADKLLIEDN